MIWYSVIWLRVHEKFKIEKEVKNQFFCNCATFIFEQELFIAFFYITTFLHKLHSYVYYEEVYYYKRFQKFIIKGVFILH